MGFAYVTSPCKLCRTLINYHPHKVPSLRDKNTMLREPVCLRCVDRLNARLTELNKPLIEVIDGAYEPFSESEL